MSNISRDVNVVDWQCQLSSVTSKNDHIFKTKEWCDVIFTVGESPKIANLKAHKLILSISSPVFATMFYGALASKNERISIVDIQPSIFELLLRYAYTDSIILNDLDVAMKLYYAAKKYMFPSLMETCNKYLLANIKLDKALEIYEFAKFHDEALLADTAMIYSAKNATKVLQEDSFRRISADTIVALFERNDLNVQKEIELINAIARNKEVLKLPEKRKEVLKRVKFLCLTPREFSECKGIVSLINLEDRYAILANLSSRNCHIPLPQIYSMNSTPRNKTLKGNHSSIYLSQNMLNGSLML